MNNILYCVNTSYPVDNCFTIGKKSVSTSPVASTPTLLDPKDCKLLGWVERGRVLEETPTCKKMKPDESPKPSKKKSSSKP